MKDLATNTRDKPGGVGRWYRIVRLGFSSRGSKAWTLSSHWDTTWAKIWLDLSLVLVAKSFVADCLRSTQQTGKFVKL
jgi:hypothetical protein